MKRLHPNLSRIAFINDCHLTISLGHIRKGKTIPHLHIPNISVWLNRKHGEINYYLQQILTRWLVYVPKLCRQGKMRKSRHIYMSQFRQRKSQVPTIENSNVIEYILKCKETWKMIHKIVGVPLKDGNPFKPDRNSSRLPELVQTAKLDQFSAIKKETVEVRYLRPRISVEIPTQTISPPKKRTLLLYAKQQGKLLSDS